MSSRNRHNNESGRDTVAVSTIAARIIALRQARGLSTTELARSCGISQPSMHNIESGRTKTLRGRTLAELARVLGASPDVILGKGSFTEAELHEAELLSLWRSLGDSQHQNILSIMRSLVGATQPSNPAPPHIGAPKGSTKAKSPHPSVR